jgi:predicted DNA-binding transcriptional regulator AlpA
MQDTPDKMLNRRLKRTSDAASRRKSSAALKRKSSATDELDTPDELVPDPTVMKEFGIIPMTLWRWDQDPRIGFPPAIKIGPRKYRSRRAIEEFKVELLRKAVENQKALYERDALNLKRKRRP